MESFLINLQLTTPSKGRLSADSGKSHNFLLFIINNVGLHHERSKFWMENDWVTALRGVWWRKKQTNT